MMPMNRSNVSIIIATISVYIVFCCNARTVESTHAKWEKADSILNEIVEPSFPSPVFNIMDFGAVADGKTLNTIAINNAITYASESGGGTILIPGGTFLTGAIHLKSNIRLHLEENARVLF